MHQYANNYGATIDSIFSIDADTLLFLVEFATMNSQNALGSGVSNLYRQSSDKFANATTDSTVVTVAADASSACIPGAVFDIGTSNGGAQVGSYIVVSVSTNQSDSTLKDITLNESVSVTTDNYWSVHGLSNMKDEDIGSKSGYIGENIRANAYYRGTVFHGNRWFYTLGVYESKDDQTVWIAQNDAQADEYDNLDTSVHYNTNVVLATSNGYINQLGLAAQNVLSVPPIATQVANGATSSNPIGDYTYNAVLTYNSLLLRGGDAGNTTLDGVFCCQWNAYPTASYWGYSARPRLKNP
jgi:hypothetical protein